MQLALNTVVGHVLATDQWDNGIYEQFLEIRNTQISLREYLIQSALDARNAVVPGAVVHLLKAAFAQMERVNLTSWTRLSAEELRTILEWEHISEHVKILSISSPLTKDAVDSLAEALPARGIEDLYIHWLAQRRQPDLTNAIVYRTLRSKVRGKIVIDKVFADALRGHMEYGLSNTIEFPTTPDCPILQIIFERRGSFDTIFLGDAMLLTPIRLVSGLLNNMLRIWLRNYQDLSVAVSNSTAAYAFASAPSSLEDNTTNTSTSKIEVSCIPKDARQKGPHEVFEYVIRNLQQGAWNVLIQIDEEMRGAPPGRYALRCFKVAFVRARRDIKATRESAKLLGPGDMDVVDIEGFLRATAPGADIGGLSALEASLNKLAEETDGVAEDTDGMFTGESVIQGFTSDEAYDFVKRAFSWAKGVFMVRKEL